MRVNEYVNALNDLIAGCAYFSKSNGPSREYQDYTKEEKQEDDARLAEVIEAARILAESHFSRDHSKFIQTKYPLE